MEGLVPKEPVKWSCYLLSCRSQGRAGVWRLVWDTVPLRCPVHGLAEMLDVKHLGLGFGEWSGVEKHLRVFGILYTIFKAMCTITKEMRVKREAA